MRMDLHETYGYCVSVPNRTRDMAEDVAAALVGWDDVRTEEVNGYNNDGDPVRVWIITATDPTDRRRKTLCTDGLLR